MSSPSGSLEAGVDLQLQDYFDQITDLRSRLLRVEGEMVAYLQGTPKSIPECLALVDSPEGQASLNRVLESAPYPHFEGVPGDPELLVKIEANGSRDIGKFVGRHFEYIAAT